MIRKPPVSLSTSQLVSRRLEELDTIAAVLPIERRDELAELLTDQDIETLRHPVNEGVGANTLRALTSDLAYLQAWALAATGRSLPWPAPEAMLLKFVAHHLWDPEKRLTDPGPGMPADIEAKLRLQGSAEDGAACPRYRPPSTGHLVDAHEMARTAWRLRLACPQVGDQAGSTSNTTP